MRGLLGSAVLLAGVCACVPTDVLPPLPDGDHLRLFVVNLEAEGARRVVVRASLTPSSKAGIAGLTDPDAELFLVALDRSAVSALHPDIALDRPEAIALVETPDPEIFDEDCAKLGVLGEDGTLSFELGTKAEVYRRSGDQWTLVPAPEAITRLGLRLPVNPCPGPDLSLHPYGDASPYVNANTIAAGRRLDRAELEQLVRIGPDELYAVTEGHLIHVRRGERYEESTRHLDARTLPVPQTQGFSFWKFEAASVVRASPSGQIESLLVGTTLGVHEGVDSGFGVFSVELEGEAFGAVTERFVFVLESTPEVVTSMHELVLGANDRWVALASRAVVTATSPNASGVSRAEVEIDAESLAYEPNADPPMIFGDRRGTIYVGDLFSNELLEFEASGTNAFVRIATFVNGAPVVGIDLPPIMRREADGWKPVHIPLPETLAECAEPVRECGRLVQGPIRVDAIEPLGDARGRFLVAWSTCQGVAVVEPRPIESCVAGVQIPVSATNDDERPEVDDVLVMEGGPVIAGNGGLLLQLEVAD